MLVSEKYYYKKVLLLNFILSCLIVTIHSIVPERYGVPLDKYPFVCSVVLFCKVATPTFFFLSAVLFYRNCCFMDLKRKLIRRVHSLLIPFILWNTFFVLIYYILTHLPFLSEKLNTTPVSLSPEDLLAAILNSEHTDLWFIRNLMVYTVLSPVFLLVLKNKILTITIYITSLFYVLCNGVGHYELITWIPIYLMGAMWGYYGWSNIRINSRIIKYIVPILFVFIYVGVYYGYIDLKIMRNISPILIWMLFDIFIYEYLNDKFETRDYFGYTFFIYATHHFVLNIMQKIVVIFFLPTQLVVNITFVITPIITVVLLVLGCRMIKNTKVYMVMCGRR